MAKLDLQRRRSQPSLASTAHAQASPSSPPLPSFLPQQKIQRSPNGSVLQKPKPGNEKKESNGSLRLSSPGKMMRRVSTFLAFSPPNGTEKSKGKVGTVYGNGIGHIAVSNSATSSVNAWSEEVEEESEDDDIRRPSGLGPPSILHWDPEEEVQKEREKKKKPRPVSQPNMIYSPPITPPPVPDVPMAGATLSRKRTTRVRPPRLTIISIPSHILLQIITLHDRPSDLALVCSTFRAVLQSQNSTNSFSLFEEKGDQITVRLSRIKESQLRLLALAVKDRRGRTRVLRFPSLFDNRILYHDTEWKAETRSIWAEAMVEGLDELEAPVSVVELLLNAKERSNTPIPTPTPSIKSRPSSPPLPPRNPARGLTTTLISPPPSSTSTAFFSANGPSPRPSLASRNSSEETHSKNTTIHPVLLNPKKKALSRLTVRINSSLVDGLRVGEVLRCIGCTPATNTNTNTLAAWSFPNSKASSSEVIIPPRTPPKSLGFTFGPRVDRRTAEKVLGAVGSSLGSEALEPEDRIDTLHITVDESIPSQMLYKSISTILPRFTDIRALSIRYPTTPDDLPPPLSESEEDQLDLFRRRCESLQEVVFVTGAKWVEQ